MYIFTKVNCFICIWLTEQINYFVKVNVKNDIFIEMTKMPSKFNGVSGQGIKMLTEWNFGYENVSFW